MSIQSSNNNKRIAKNTFCFTSQSQQGIVFQLQRQLNKIIQTNKSLKNEIFQTNKWLENEFFQTNIILKIQYIGTRKSAYTKGYALN